MTAAQIINKAQDYVIVANSLVLTKIAFDKDAVNTGTYKRLIREQMEEAFKILAMLPHVDKDDNEIQLWANLTFALDSLTQYI